MTNPPNRDGIADLYCHLARRARQYCDSTPILRRSVSDGMIMLIIRLSATGYVIALQRVPRNAAALIVGITQNRHLLITPLVVLIHWR